MMDKKKLCKQAIQAMQNAHAPYSGYKVGAALLTADGRVYTGCNIENASYSATVCAERTAVFKAISEGKTDFAMLAVAGGKNSVIDGAFPPCGVCRQVLAEFCPPKFLVLVVTAMDGSFTEYTLEELLPEAFGGKHMN